LLVDFYQNSDLKAVGVIMADAISRQALSDLIGSIYDCALDPSRWEQTLPDVADTFNCHILTLSLTDRRQLRFLLFKTFGLQPHIVEQNPKHIPEIHAMLSEALASWPSLDEPWVVSRHLAAAYIETSPFFRELLSVHK
jgi:hypothetical protein